MTRSRFHRWRWALAGALLMALALGAALRKVEHVRIGAETVVFGLPLVLMDLTRENSQHKLGPANALRRVRQFPGPNFRDVVRPNVDTLYTSAFIDMAAGPWVLAVAPNSSRYELLAILDAWTDVAAAPGTRTHGAQGGNYLLVGAGYSGPIPAGLTPLRVQTQIAWLIGRTQTRGQTDLAHVHALQDGLQLVHLTHWLQGQRSAVAPTWQAQRVDLTPLQQLEQMSTHEFVQRLMQLLPNNPPRPADAPLLGRMTDIGLEPGQMPHWSDLEWAAVRLGRWLAVRKLRQALQDKQNDGGWQYPPDILGRYGSNYGVRAAVALVGLGANWPEDSLYPQTRRDAQGQTLHGDRRYRLRFAAGALPPVRAFWSITAYGQDDFLQPTSSGRHALGSADDLAYNADGSLDLWVQAHAPADAQQRRNWLPVLAGVPFTLTARLYWPQTAALQGSWQFPPLEQMQ